MKDYSFYQIGIAKSFVYPTLLILILPVFSWWFFNHAESWLDGEVLASIEETLRARPDLPAADRAKVVEFFQSMPMSEVLRSDDPELRKLGDDLTAQTRFDYATFRWMIRLSILSMSATAAALLFIGLSAVLFVRPRRAQYVNLSIGWYVLRILSAVQVIAQGILIFALSYWITALWFGVYFPQILIISGIAVVAVALGVGASIFKRVDCAPELDGRVLERDPASHLWAYVDELSLAAGTAPPDRIVAGIDSKFFVTELPVTVDGLRYTGRTLYVSLPLLKALHEREVDAALVHELSHFSNEDAFYSKKLLPLVVHYDAYVLALRSGMSVGVLFHYILLLRAVHTPSLRRYVLERELRADRIAAESTSPKYVAGALLRVAAYSRYRDNVEKELFGAREAHTEVCIGKRIEEGFPDFAVRFAEQEDIADLKATHPSDSHPPLLTRLENVEFTPAVSEIRAILSEVPDGGWFWKIDDAEVLEAELWSDYEAHFQTFHNEDLPFRYLPATDEEREVVEQSFPEVAFTIPGATTVVLDCLRVSTTDWETPVDYSEITNIVAETKWGKPRLRLQLTGDDTQERIIPLSKKAADHQEMVATLEKYIARYRTAVEYQQSLAEEDGPQQEAAEE